MNSTSLLPTELHIMLDRAILEVDRFWQQNRYHHHFTNHGPEHSERVYRKLMQLALELPKDHCLTEDEILIVSAAAWLYEIGMQSTDLKAVLGLDYRAGDSLSSSQLQQIRAKKHLLTYQIIRDGMRGNESSPSLTFLPPDYARTVAEVCRWCSEDPLESMPYDELPVRGKTVRVRLLVALLRLADQLYIDGARVNLKLLSRFNLPDREFARWWVYHYVQVLSIENGLIHFGYLLPSMQKEYLGPIRALVEPDFERSRNPLIRYLGDKCRLHLMPFEVPTVQVDWSVGSLPTMDDRVTSYLEKTIPLPALQGEVLQMPNQNQFTETNKEKYPQRIEQALEERLVGLADDYEAASRQLNNALSEVERSRLKRQLGEMEKEIRQVEGELDVLRSSRVNEFKSAKLRLDVAVPDQVYLGRTFELAFAIRCPSSPVLADEELAHVRSGDVRVWWFTSEADLHLQVRVSAPECEIHGPDSYSIHFHPDEDSPRFFFHLTPKALGQIGIIVQVYQENEWLGSARAHTIVQEQIVGSVQIKTTSHNIGDEKMPDYKDFELRIDTHGHITAHSLEGDRIADIPVATPNNIQLTLDLIEGNRTNEQLLKDFGKQLYEILFPSPIHTHLNQTEAVARDRGQKVRIRLIIEPDTLAKLPWEFVYREEGGYFLATNPKTVLSRYLNLPLPPNRVRRREGALHILMIISDPKDQQVRLDPDEWERIVLGALETPIRDGLITTETVKCATFEQIKDALLNKQPDIIQFVGHGIYRDDKGYLALVDSSTSKTWEVDDAGFADILQGYDDHLGLLCLATCESAKSDSPQGFLGIAPRIVQRGIPAVVAMQYVVLVPTAKVFLENLYKDLAARKPVDWAVQDARNAVAIKQGRDNREFATPVLYMRAEDGNIF